MRDDYTIGWYNAVSIGEKRAYEVGRAAGFRKVSTLTYGKGFRSELVEQAYARGYKEEQQAARAKVSFDVNRWNIALESMVPHLRALEEIARSIPGPHGQSLRTLTQRIADRISDAVIVEHL